MHSRMIVAVALVVLLAACIKTPPVTYPIPPGISASVPPSQLKMSLQYASTFCSVLRERAFDGDGWGACDTYLKMEAVPQPAPPPELSNDWTLLLVGGLGAQCFAPDVVAFDDAARHLEKFHSMKSYVIPVAAFDTTEQNAVALRDYVAKLSEKRFIAVTHSKGAADFMVALAAYPNELKRVEALITVAGAVGGSWLVDDFTELNQKVLRKFSLPQCLPPPRGVPNGIDSMRRRTRQEYLARTEPIWRAYSITAVSDERNTSDVLIPLWKRVRPYAMEQDSHIVERESVVPGGKFLGRALGDHWAVAMPFHGNPRVPGDALEIINHNRFPRAALIEAAVRVVIDDLRSAR